MDRTPASHPSGDAPDTPERHNQLSLEALPHLLTRSARTRKNIVPELESLRQKPDLWPSVDLDDLKDLALLEFVRYGRGGREEDAHVLKELYPLLLERTTVADRRELLGRVCELVEEGSLGPFTFFPFIFADSAFQIVSTASLDYAVLARLENGDLLTGPKFLRDQLFEIDDPDTRAGIFGGLLAIGDRRLVNLWDECWRALDLEERRAVLGTRRPFVYAPIVDFYLDCLEEEPEDGVYGTLAAGVQRMVGEREHPRVLEIRRAFPATAPGEESIRVVDNWTFAEYGRRIEPRLRALAAAESPPRVLPRVMKAWGLSCNGLAADLAGRCAEDIRSAGLAGTLLADPLTGCEFVTLAEEREVLVGVRHPEPVRTHALPPVAPARPRDARAPPHV